MHVGSRHRAALVALLLASLASLLPLSPTPPAHAQLAAPARDDNTWNRRVPGAGDFQTVAELSGRVEAARFFDVSSGNATIASLCGMKSGTEGGIEVLETALASRERREKTPRLLGELFYLHYTLGQLAAYTGDMTKTIEHLEAAYAATDGAELGESRDLAKRQLEELLGVAYMRRGELENCVHDRNADRCIFPITPAGRHTNKEGASKAVAYFTKHLEANPGNLEVRWLLNVAYMVLGDYPAKVPKAFLLAPSIFASTAKAGRFVDVAAERGIDAVGDAGGAIVDDFDGDGDLDVVFSSVDACESLRFYRNRGDGSFEDRTDAAGLASQLGGINCVQTDFDNDGFLDIFVMRGGWEFGMPNSLLRNDGDGTFTDVTEASGLGGRPFRTHTAAWADYDNDGKVDLYVGNEEAPSQLFHNDGDGTFTDVSRESGLGVTAFTKGAAWGDYDGDGDADLYVSNYVGTNFLFRNDGDGTFTDVAKELGVERPIMSFPTWFWDYDNDGRLDLFVANYVPSVAEFVRGYLGLEPHAETLKLYRNTGGGFEDVTAKVGLDRVVATMGANFGDVDNDGFLDVYLGTGAPSYAALVPNFMLRNDGGKSFADVTAASGTGHLQKGHGVAFGDVDGDGDEDLCLNVGGFVPGDAYNKVLFENPGGGGNWISIKLVGEKANRAAIGAKLRLTLGDGEPGAIRYREVSSGGSFGASTFTREIGLGRATKIAKLEVWWPSETGWRTYRDIPANRFVEIRESSATIAPRHDHRRR